MKKVLGIGNALVDIISFIEDDSLLDFLSLPKGSMQLVDASTSRKIQQHISGYKSHFASGGSAANTIHGLAKLGVSTGFIGTVGRDDMGGFFQEDMKRSGINTYLLTATQPTGMAISLVSNDGERTFATYLGAAVDILTEGIRSSVFEVYDYLHIEGYLVQNHNLIGYVLPLAKKHNMTVSLDLASYNVVEANLKYLHYIVENYVDIVFANESEAYAFTSIKDPEGALRRIASKCQTAIVKTGEKGSLVMQDNIVYKVGAIDACCLDTTGAGDLYAAGFLYGLVKGFPPDLCGRIGSLLAGKVIEEPGAKIGPEGWEVIFKTIREFQR